MTASYQEILLQTATMTHQKERSDVLLLESDFKFLHSVPHQATSLLEYDLSLTFKHSSPFMNSEEVLGTGKNKLIVSLQHSLFYARAGVRGDGCNTDSF